MVWIQLTMSTFIRLWLILVAILVVVAIFFPRTLVLLLLCMSMLYSFSYNLLIANALSKHLVTFWYIDIILFFDLFVH